MNPCHDHVQECVRQNMSNLRQNDHKEDRLTDGSKVGNRPPQKLVLVFIRKKIRKRKKKKEGKKKEGKKKKKEEEEDCTKNYRLFYFS